MELTPGMAKLAKYWGTIQAAVEGKASTSELWSAVQSAAASATGEGLSGVTISDIGRLRSLAAANRNAAAAFERAGENEGLTSGTIGTLLHAELPQGDRPQDWLIRFEHTVIDENGEQRSVWRSSTFRGLLPPTKADLLAQLEDDAQRLADDYNETHVGVGNVSIMSA